MNLLVEVASELFSMFVGDTRLSICVLALVAGVAALTMFTQPLFGGIALVAGCLVLLLESVLRAARQKP